MAAHDSRNLHLMEMIDGHLTVYLQPGFCNKVANGVRQELNNSLLRYLDDHEAVLLGYKNVRIVTKQALLTPWLPYLTIEAQAKLLWLKPVPGKILVGRVHKLNEGMLSLLVLGGINASISAEKMPDGFAFDTQNQCWVPDADHSRAIIMGDFVACRVLTTPVTDPEENQLLFNLEATLRDPEAGLCCRQIELQNKKRSHLAATVAGMKPVQPTAQGPTEAGQEPNNQQSHKKQHQNGRKQHTQEYEKYSLCKQDKQRSREEGKEQHKAKKRKVTTGYNQQIPHHH